MFFRSPKCWQHCISCRHNYTTTTYKWNSLAYPVVGIRSSDLRVFENRIETSLCIIKWIIITSENADEVFKRLEEAGIDPVLFGITDKDFQVLARNFAQIRQKLQETNNLLEEYKKYYEDSGNTQ